MLENIFWFWILPSAVVFYLLSLIMSLDNVSLRDLDKPQLACLFGLSVFWPVGIVSLIFAIASIRSERDDTT